MISGSKVVSKIIPYMLMGQEPMKEQNGLKFIIPPIKIVQTYSIDIQILFLWLDGLGHPLSFLARIDLKPEKISPDFPSADVWKKNAMISDEGILS